MLTVQVTVLSSDQLCDQQVRYLNISVFCLSDIDQCNEGGSVAEWLACWTQAQQGLGSNCSHDAVG